MNVNGKYISTAEKFYSRNPTFKTVGQVIKIESHLWAISMVIIK